MKKSTHQRLLDEFCLEKVLRGKLSSTWKQWHKNFREMEELRHQSDENSAQTQLLSYQLSELEDLDIRENEVEALETEFKKLNSADEIISAASNALAISHSDGDTSVLSLLHSTLNTLRDISNKPEQIKTIIQLMESAQIQMEESISDLRSFYEEFDANPDRLEQINVRLSQLQDVARKHKVKANDLLLFIKELRSQLHRFENCDEELAKLASNNELLKEQYKDDPFYANMKTAFFLHTLDDYRMFSRDSYSKLDLSPEGNSNYFDNVKLAIEHSDYVVAVNDGKGSLIDDIKNDKEINKIFKKSEHMIVDIPKNASRSVWVEVANDIEIALRKI